MIETLKKYIKSLYLKGSIDAERFSELNSVANDLLDAKNNTEERQMIFEYAVGDYPEFKPFLIQYRLRAAEELESIFMARIDEHIARHDIEKASMIMEMMNTIEG